MRKPDQSISWARRERLQPGRGCERPGRPRFSWVLFQISKFGSDLFGFFLSEWSEVVFLLHPEEEEEEMTGGGSALHHNTYICLPFCSLWNQELSLWLAAVVVTGGWRYG